jgi:hypothetical protein
VVFFKSTLLKTVGIVTFNRTERTSFSSFRVDTKTAWMIVKPTVDRKETSHFNVSLMRQRYMRVPDEQILPCSFSAKAYVKGEGPYLEEEFGAVKFKAY